MPGPVSDSYDSEFSTAANREDVRDSAREVNEEIGLAIGDKLKNITQVVQGKDGDSFRFDFTEKDLRVIRFCLNRFIDE